jgi:hypothetical protein
MALTKCSECGGEVSDRALMCPHCGAPRGRIGARMYGREWRSPVTVLGLPLVHIATGVDLYTGRKRIAKGIIAIGDVAIGVVAIGGAAIGGIAVGGFALGLLAALGGAAIGCGVSVGGLAVGYLAVGGMAFGIWAYGGGAIGIHAVQGGSVRPSYFHFGRR